MEGREAPTQTLVECQALLNLCWETSSLDSSQAVPLATGHRLDSRLCSLLSRERLFTPNLCLTEGESRQGVQHRLPSLLLSLLQPELYPHPEPTRAVTGATIPQTILSLRSVVCPPTSPPLVGPN